MALSQPEITLIDLLVLDARKEATSCLRWAKAIWNLLEVK